MMLLCCRLRVFLLGLTCCAAARGESVPLPYQVPDPHGNQWVVFYQGSLQQQGNQPLFSQAGMITLNGQQPQQNNQVGSFDPEAQELTLTFDARGPIRHQRRLRFEAEGTVVRVIDVVENTADRETSVNVQLMTNTNFGVTESNLVADPRYKAPARAAADEAHIGWVANTGAQRAVMALLAGKGSPVRPVIRYQLNSNQCFAQYPLKLGAGQRAAIAHWYGTFDSVEQGQEWIESLKESRAVSDLPLDLRKSLINVRGLAGGFIGDRELLRGSPTADIVELTGGDQMRGEIKIERYTLKTPYGPVTLPAARVAGLLNIGEYRPRQLVITADGEVFGGELEQQAISLQLASGQVTQVPLAQVSRVGYRTPDADGAEWKFDQPMAFLTSGERFRIEVPPEPIGLASRYGTLKLAPAQISTILLGAGGLHKVYLVDGSLLTGVIDRTSWPLRLVSSAAEAGIAIPSAAIQRLQFKPPAPDAGSGAATVALAGEDLVSARLDGQIRLVTSFDTLTLDAGQVASIRRADPGLPDVQVTMFDQSTFRGTIDAPTLPIVLTAGPKLEVPTMALREYDNPRPLPAPAVVEQARALIARLGAEAWDEREQVQAELTAMGPGILPLLEEAAPAQPVEARDRLAAIIQTLRKDQPVLPSRLVPPPAVE